LTNKKRLIVGISGATGAVYGVRILEILSRIEDIESHLVLTKAGKMTIQVATPYSIKDVEAMADVVHDVNNVGASISSGSFRTEGMVIAPCSMKSMGSIAHSIGGDLLVRAADVVLKERKKLVLVVRETRFTLDILKPWCHSRAWVRWCFRPCRQHHRPKTLDEVISNRDASWISSISM
jgi:4-hydroxy-3-polyprenylbenzoate decarboxylase